jgi:hypothetical protein
MNIAIEPYSRLSRKVSLLTDLSSLPAPIFRLLRYPRRLGGRYLLRGPRIFLLLPRIKLRLRRPMAVPAIEPPEVPPAPA